MSSQARVRIKICGITRLTDALCAVKAGVDGLGFIFYEKSPRAIEPEAARLIIEQLPPLVATVGVFVDHDNQQVKAIIKQCSLGYAQLHGAESPEYCHRLKADVTPCRLLKAIRVGPPATAAEVALYQDSVQGFVLDTYQKNVVGGTGEAFDWAKIDCLNLKKPFLLAGGLNIDNIGTALARVRPYGVDANSGLEDAPGIKNHHLIRQFIGAVREFEARYLTGEQ